MTNSVFTIILIFFILNVGLLSKWLSYLFQENSKELSFPAELGYSWLATACTASSNAGSSAAEALFFAIYTVFLLTMLCSDIEQQIIFDKQLALFAIFGLLRSLLFSLPWEQHLLAALAGGLSFLLLAILTRGGIGGGDIKLIAALGLWLGGEALKLTALGGIIIGGLWALGAIAVIKKKRTDFIPYAPAFIIAAFALYILQASHG